jgi:prepilin-type N-terminal cleavage/methylation domain-containing protein
MTPRRASVTLPAESKHFNGLATMRPAIITPLSSPRMRGSSIKESRGADAPHWIPAFAGMTKNAGFSLIELSVVLVILGLLVGGILAGQSLIRAAELRSVTTDFEKYVAATKAFKTKYESLPGDMPYAIDVWGEAHATPATCVTTASTGTETCNGDGNGIVSPSVGSNEAFRYWQHLANAGLIEGRFNGIACPSVSYCTDAANSPSSKISNSLWLMWTWGIRGGTDPAIFAGDFTRMYLFGRQTTGAAPETNNLKTEELWNIDTKMDDGRPGSGTLVSRNWSDDCTNAASGGDTSATYELSNSAIVCRAVFRGMF